MRWMLELWLLSERGLLNQVKPLRGHAESPIRLSMERNVSVDACVRRVLTLPADWGSGRVGAIALRGAV